MKKINLVFVALAATALLWCLDRATGTSEAAGDCRCETVTIQTVVGEDGRVVVQLEDGVGLTSMPIKIPMITVYRSIPTSPTVTIEPSTFQLDRAGRVIVQDEPGTVIYITMLK